MFRKNAKKFHMDNAIARNPSIIVKNGAKHVKEWIKLHGMTYNVLKYENFKINCKVNTVSTLEKNGN